MTANRLRAGLLFVTLLGFALRLYTLDGQSLWYDEGVTAAIAQLDLPALTRWTANDIQPPLYYYLVAGWGQLGGWSEWALRLPSALFGVLSVSLLAAVARRLLHYQSHDREGVDKPLTFPAPIETGKRLHYQSHDREGVDGSLTLPAPIGTPKRINASGLASGAALLAALLAAVHPLLVYYGQEARMYTLLVCLGILIAYLLLRLADAPRPSWWLWGVYILAATAALYTHYFALFLLAGLGCAWLLDAPHVGVRTGQERKLRTGQPDEFIAHPLTRSPAHLLAANLAVAILYLPWAAVLLAQLTGDRSYWLGDLKLHEALLDVLVRFTSGETMSERTALWLLLAYGAVTLVAAYGLWRGWPQTRRLLLYAGFWLLIPLVAVLALAFNVPKFNARYVMPALPGLLLLWAGGLAALASGSSFGARQLAQTAPRRAERVAGLLVTALCLLLLIGGALWSNANWFLDRGFAKDNWRELTAFLRTRAAPDEQIVLVSGHAWPVWDYYAPDLPVVRLPDLRILDVDAVLDFADTQPALAAAFAEETGKRGAWLVNWQDEVVDPNDVVPVQLELGGREKGQNATFQGLTLRRYGGIRASRFAAEPPVTHVLDTAFYAEAEAGDAGNGNERVRLHGYTVLNNGDLLLFWQRQTLADPSGRSGGDLRLALESATLDGQPLAHPQDRRPAGYMDPAFRWPQGEVVMGRIPAADWLGANPAAGQVQVTLRVYDAAAPAAPLRTAEGADHLLLSPVEVIID